MKSITKIITAGMAVAILSATLTGCDITDYIDINLSGGQSESAPIDKANVPAPVYDTATEVSTLVVAEEVSMAGYDRPVQFPTWLAATPDLGWTDANANCDVRWATLWRDGVDLEWYDYDQCYMDDPGYWVDPYGEFDEDGNLVFLQSADPSDFDIDHIIATGLAWRSGAQGWTQETRTQFANDPENLVTVKASINRSKGDQSADTYVPPSDYRCVYIEKYVHIKAKYQLTVTQPELDRINTVLAECA